MKGGKNRSNVFVLLCTHVNAFVYPSGSRILNELSSVWIKRCLSNSIISRDKSHFLKVSKSA